jgi:hypothetical protein
MKELVSNLKNDHYEKLLKQQQSAIKARSKQDQEISRLHSQLEQNKNNYELMIDELQIQIKSLQLTIHSKDQQISSIHDKLIAKVGVEAELRSALD